MALSSSLTAGAASAAVQAAPPAAASEMQRISTFSIDRSEVTVGAFRRFVQATGLRTQAERQGGGMTYEAGWEQRSGWVWHSPYGSPAADDEPAVHIRYDEAEAYCRWAGQRLPTEAEWREAAYTERRAQPPAPWVAGRRYPYPTGDRPTGANCLGDCGDRAPTVAHAVSSRGKGHAPTASTPAGVNGLFDMGGNVWEWAQGGTPNARPTLGGSWWYGAGPMHYEHRATKPEETAVVYIGFRCARSNQ